MKVRDLPIEERMRLYNEAWKIRREFGYGSHRIAKMLNISKSAVNDWFYRNVCPEWVRITFVPKASDELSYVLGAIFGDACIWKDKNDNCHIELKAIDKEFVEKFATCMTKIFDKSSVNSIHYTYDGYWRVIYGSREFYKFVQMLTLESIKHLITGYEANFLKGLFDSEGSVHVRAVVNFDILVGLANTDKELLEFVANILRTKFRINPYLIKVKKKGSPIKFGIGKYIRNKDVWRLNLHDLNGIKTFMKEIGFSIERKQTKLEDALKINDKFSRVESCIVWRSNYEIVGREWIRIKAL